MASEVSATSLFCGPARLRHNVVLRHEGGVITAVSEAAALPAIERELRTKYRISVGRLLPLQQAWQPLTEQLAGWFEKQLTCQ